MRTLDTEKLATAKKLQAKASRAALAYAEHVATMSVVDLRAHAAGLGHRNVSSANRAYLHDVLGVEPAPES